MRHFHPPEPPSVKGHGGHVLRAGSRSAGDDHGGRSHAGKSTELIPQSLQTDVRPVRLIEQKGRFRKIGRDDVGLTHKAAHGFHHFRRLRGIKAAVVAENGVDHGYAARRTKLADAAPGKTGLIRTAEKTGIDGVELQTEARPVIHHGSHLVGEIKKGEVVDSGRL